MFEEPYYKYYPKSHTNTMNALPFTKEATITRPHILNSVHHTSNVFTLALSADSKSNVRGSQWHRLEYSSKQYRSEQWWACRCC